VDELHQPSQRLYVTNLLAHVALLEGDFAEAERLIHEALELGERAQRWNARITYHLQLFMLRDAQGRLEEVAEIYEAGSSAQEFRTYPVFDCVVAGFYARVGRADEARATFEELAASDFAGIPFDEEWLASICLLAEMAAWLGDATHAHALYALLSPYGERLGTSYPEINVGAVSRYLGLLAATESRWGDAARHFDDALEINGRTGARPWLAHTQEDYAHMLRRRGGAGDDDRAAELFDSALATYRELSMLGPLARATSVS
jgi:tetratricopeptide (TPR) repeat protein